jgi:hypothetical protein
MDDRCVRLREGFGDFSRSLTGYGIDEPTIAKPSLHLGATTQRPVGRGSVHRGDAQQKLDIHPMLRISHFVVMLPVHSMYLCLNQPSNICTRMANARNATPPILEQKTLQLYNTNLRHPTRTSEGRYSHSNNLYVAVAYADSGRLDTRLCSGGFGIAVKLEDC